MTTPHSTDKKSESQRGDTTFPKTQKLQTPEPALTAMLLGKSPLQLSQGPAACAEPADKLRPNTEEAEEVMSKVKGRWVTGKLNVK